MNYKKIRLLQSNEFKLQENIRNYEKAFDNCRNENDGLKNDLLNERSLRAEKENEKEK